MSTEVDLTEKFKTLLFVLKKLPSFREDEYLRFFRNEKEFRVWFHCCDDPALIGPETVGYLAELLLTHSERDAQSIFCAKVSSQSRHKVYSEEVAALRKANHELGEFSNWQDSGWPISFFSDFFLALALEKPSLKLREYCQCCADQESLIMCSWCGLSFPLKDGLCELCETFWDKV